MEKRLTIDDFIYAFYNLFTLYDGSSFVGNKELARILVQDKLHCFIPIPYIEKAFRTFRANMIYKVNDKKIIPNVVLSDKYPMLGKQQQYLLNSNIKIENILHELRHEFKDFLSKVHEMPFDEDIDVLRALEKEKGIKFSSIVPHNRRSVLNRNLEFVHYPSKTQFDESNNTHLKYFFSREEIIDIIKNLRKYDSEEIAREKMELDKKFIKYTFVRDQHLEKFCNKTISFLNRVNNLSAKLYVLMTDDNYDKEKNFIGVMNVETIEFNENEAVINNNHTQIFIYGYEYPYIEISDKVIIEIEGSKMLAVFEIDIDPFDDEIDYLHLLQQRFQRLNSSGIMDYEHY